MNDDTPTAQPSDEHVCPACRGTGRTDNIAYTPPPAQPSDEELAAKVLRQMGDGFMPTSDDELHHYGAECSFQSRAAGREQGRREARHEYADFLATWVFNCTECGHKGPLTRLEIDVAAARKEK